ncbi:hypothetical protein [Zhihengliuella halotolerans]|uniref:DUF559 domain-containing protein n=1 Tax=Zhihengliuella halotolerans TaxID=370736 RepID=A0A4V2G9L3_9MICC|nr:hypothetical protein [Zhihengliuella halotolerans]RZU60786.1 hypothetical protein EV380_0334 [Zhihengliuella halotolerans]
MSLPSPLPRELAGRVFTTARARTLGVNRARLRCSDMHRLHRGIFSHLNSDPNPLAVCAALAEEHRHLWASHWTAARAHGLWLPLDAPDSQVLHVSRSKTYSQLKLTTARCHWLDVLESELETRDMAAAGPPGAVARLSTPARTWLDLSPELAHEDLVALGDQLVRHPYPKFEHRTTPFATPDSLRGLLAAHPWAPGARAARAALAQVRVGSDSPAETRLRLAVLATCLPQPDLQIRLRPQDPYSPTADLGYRRLRFGVQYEGRGHRTAEQLSRDNRRDAAFNEAGWLYLKFDASDYENGFMQASWRIRQAYDRLASRTR